MTDLLGTGHIMWRFSALFLLVTCFLFRAEGYGPYPDRNEFEPLPYRSFYPEYESEVEGRADSVPKPTGQDSSASGIMNQLYPPNHGIVSGVHLVAVTAPQSLLTGTNGQNILQYLFEHLLHEAQHGQRDIVE